LGLGGANYRCLDKLPKFWLPTIVVVCKERLKLGFGVLVIKLPYCTLVIDLACDIILYKLVFLVCFEQMISIEQ